MFFSRKSLVDKNCRLTIPVGAEPGFYSGSIADHYRAKRKPASGARFVPPSLLVVDPKLVDDHWKSVRIGQRAPHSPGTPNDEG